MPEAPGVAVLRSGERFRGGDPAAGVDTRHAFSFGRHYDPGRLRFGALLACNEERLAPGAGFAEHPHRDVEIVTWVVEGVLTHRDSTGRTTLVHPGDLQRLGAGRGVRHVERNDGDRPLRFLQMWLEPARGGGDPEYEVVRGLAEGAPYPLERAGAVLRVRRPEAGGRIAPPDADRCYVHVVRGALALESGPSGAAPGGVRDAAPGAVPGTVLAAGDAARITGRPDAVLTATAPAEALVWELPRPHAPRPAAAPPRRSPAAPSP